MEWVNLSTSVGAIILSIVAIILSLGAKKNLEKAGDIMEKVEKQVGVIKASVEGQIKEAWKVGMDRIRGEVKMPEITEIKKLGEMVKVFTEIGMGDTVKELIKSGIKQGQIESNTKKT